MGEWAELRASAEAAAEQLRTGPREWPGRPSAQRLAFFLAASPDAILRLLDSAPLAMVREFHEHVGAAVRTAPTVDVPGAIMRVEFVEEEARELRKAVETGDVTEVADALADLAYVVYGGALHFGIPIDAVLAEVHRSNMTKEPAGDGKAVKGSGYSPPDIASALEAS